MQSSTRRPSPALVISIIALVVALSGTAVAAKILISSSSQIKNGTIHGVDIANGTIGKSKLSDSALGGITGSSASDATPSGVAALEAHRLKGPDMPKGGSAQVLELPLAPGTYAVFAKADLTSDINDRGLLDTLFKDPKTIGGACTLDVNGTGDYAIGAIVSPGSANPVTLNTQVTRTLDAPGKATLNCRADDVHWSSANASIIALKIGSTTRTEAR